MTEGTQEMLRSLWQDDAGVVVSADLVLVLTVAVLSMIVGLNELAAGVVHELADVGDAIGHMDQSYFVSGFASHKTIGHGHGQFKSRVSASRFTDNADDCDNCSGAQSLSCAGAFGNECAAR